MADTDEAVVHTHHEPQPDPKVGHERKVIQRAAAEALRSIVEAHNTFRMTEDRVRRERERAEVAFRELQDQILLFSQYHLSFEEVVKVLPCCQPQPDRIEFWKKVQKGLTYA